MKTIRRGRTHAGESRRGCRGTLRVDVSEGAFRDVAFRSEPDRARAERHTGTSRPTAGDPTGRVGTHPDAYHQRMNAAAWFMIAIFALFGRTHVAVLLGERRDREVEADVRREARRRLGRRPRRRRSRARQRGNPGLGAWLPPGRSSRRLNRLRSKQSLTPGIRSQSPVGPCAVASMISRLHGRNPTTFKGVSPGRPDDLLGARKPSGNQTRMS